jgi:hypothetical protein
MQGSDHGRNGGPVERRTEERQIPVLRVAKLVTSRGEHLCRIRNISAGGAMAETPGTYWTGEVAAIELKSGGRVDGRIVWVDAGQIGIAFDERIDPDEILAADARQSQRLLRVAIDAEASLCIGGTYIRVRLTDISPGGLRIAFEEADAVGCKAFVTLDGLPTIAGVIRWQREGHAGIAFDDMLEHDVLAWWLAIRL